LGFAVYREGNGRSSEYQNTLLLPQLGMEMLLGITFYKLLLIVTLGKNLHLLLTVVGIF
jgi:hypothetical protein